MSVWPKCSVCEKDIMAGETFVRLSYDAESHSMKLAHERCKQGNSIKVRRMNDARAWAVAQHANLKEPASGAA